jgi:hypothetical protein
MKRIIHLYLFGFLLIVSCTLTNNLRAQVDYFFSEGTSTSFYDQGIVDISNLGSSSFEHTSPPGYPQYNDKVPCSTTAFQGTSSLKFNYTSSPTGNWKATIYRKDWSTADISQKDSIQFYIYSDSELPNIALPKIGLKTIHISGSGEIESELYALADYNTTVSAGTWTKIRFPLSVLFNDPDNSNLDFTKVKGIIFNQSESDNSSRLLYIDQLVTYKSIGQIPAITDFTANAYDSHAELNWTFPMEDLSYRIFASFDDGQTYEVRGETNANYYLDFVPSSEKNSTVLYHLIAFVIDNESQAVDASATLNDFTDDELLDMYQRYSFRYFWEGAHQSSGMALERTNGGNTTAASGATGMGLMAMIIAHEREYKDKEEIKDRIIHILDFLETCDRHHGAWSHWYYADTKQTQPFSTKDDGGDLVETSYVASALVALRNYFSGSDDKSVQIREKSSLLLNGIEWDWYRQGGQNVLYWHWSPNYGFQINMQLKGWNEALITYIMAASSPTYTVPNTVYDNGWASNGGMVNERTYYSYKINLSPDYGGALFWIHYSFLGLNPKGLKDQYADYWTETVNTARIHYAYAVSNPKGHTNYGSKCWGLTASDDPYGYTAHQPMYNDNGTISPTAALASMPYTPEESIRALKYFYQERGKDLFGIYGPYDAFNDNLSWVQESYIGIDQGPIVVMIENYRTGLIWNNVMKDPDIQAGLNKLGFTYETISSINDMDLQNSFRIYPNPANDLINIDIESINIQENYEFELYTLDGKLILSKPFNSFHSNSSIELPKLNNGIYLAFLIGKKSCYRSELIIQK